MKSILITGSSSFLGWNLCNYAKSDYEVFGTALTNRSGIAEVKESKIDLTSFDDCRKFIEEIKPDGIIHNAAYSKPDLCEKDPDYSKKLNVDTSSNLAKIASENSIAFAFISTDLVYNGSSKMSDESTPVDPLSVYGKHKVEAEDLVLQHNSSFTVFRCPLMYGHSTTANKGYFKGFYDKMKNGEALKLFIDEYRSQAIASDVAKGIVDLFNDGVSGIFNMGGPQRVSRFEFGMLMKSVLHLDKAQIIPASQKDVPSVAPRAADTSMDITKARSYGYDPSAPIKGLIQLAEEIKEYLQIE